MARHPHAARRNPRRRPCGIGALWSGCEPAEAGSFRAGNRILGDMPSLKAMSLPNLEAFLQLTREEPSHFFKKKLTMSSNVAREQADRAPKRTIKCELTKSPICPAPSLSPLRSAVAAVLTPPPTAAGPAGRAARTRAVHPADPRAAPVGRAPADPPAAVAPAIRAERAAPPARTAAGTRVS